jgi:hypothetical protein
MVRTPANKIPLRPLCVKLLPDEIVALGHAARLTNTSRNALTRSLIKAGLAAISSETLITKSPVAIDPTLKN